MPNPFFMVAVLFVIMLALKPDTDVTAIGGGSETDRERVAALSRAWIESYVAGDFDTAVAIMHDDAVLMPGNEPSLRGDEEIRAYLDTRTGRAYAGFVNEPEEIRIDGDWAYVRGYFTVTVDAGPDQAADVRSGRYFVLCEKVGDDWKVLRSIDNLAPAAAG